MIVINSTQVLQFVQFLYLLLDLLRGWVECVQVLLHLMNQLQEMDLLLLLHDLDQCSLNDLLPLIIQCLLLQILVTD